MSVSTLFVLHGLQSTSPSFFLAQITNVRATTEAQKLVASAAGMPFPQFVATPSQKPGLTFDTTQVSTVLAQTGLKGVDLTGGQCFLYFKKATQLATRVANATTSHMRVLAEQSGLFWDRISASNRGQASISCLLKIPYDGTNAPLIPSGSVALAGTSVASEQFVCGPVSINGTSLPAVQSITIESDIKFIEVSGESDLYDTFIAVEKVAPTITVRTLNLPALTTYGINPTALDGSAGVVAYLKACALDGSYVANATTSHIKFAALIGDIQLNEVSAGDNKPAETEIKFTLVGADASTDPLTITTGSAIT